MYVYLDFRNVLCECASASRMSVCVHVCFFVRDSVVKGR